MRRAFHALRNGRPGPVVVDIPADVGPENVPDSAFNYHSPKAFLQAPSYDDVKDAVNALLEAKTPVIWSGAGVLFSGATSELKELAELLEVPVFCTMPGKSSFDERHPLSLGAGSGATTLAAHKWLKECDLVFALGSSLTRTSYGQSIPPGKIIIQNTDSIDDINKDESINIGLPGDCKLTLKLVIDEVKSKLGKNGQKERINIERDICEVKDKWMQEWSPLLSSDEIPINAYRVICDINKTLDWENSIVTHDAGAPRDSIMPFYTATVPHSYVGWGKTTHLGFGIPLMIGAKLAHPDKFCLNLMGDGAFGMSGLDIETAVRSGASITTVVLNNGGMATYPGGYPVARERYGVTHMNSDYAKIAEGMGAIGITVKRPNEMVGALEDAQKLNAEGQTVLIDVHSNMEGRRSQW
jgi:thiamine pyrophosphate-dependent acetolactate synthase large subunit-like protein